MAFTSSSTERVDALDVGFLNDRGKGLLGGPAGFQERREVAPRAKLRDLEIDAAGARVPGAVAVAVATVRALGTAFAEGRATAALDVHLHHALGDVLDHLAQEVRVGPLLSELGQCHSGLGHRVSPRFRLRSANPTLSKNHDGPLRGRRRDQRFASPTAPLRADPDLPSYTTSWDVNPLPPPAREHDHEPVTLAP